MFTYIILQESVKVTTHSSKSPRPGFRLNNRTLSRNGRKSGQRSKMHPFLEMCRCLGTGNVRSQRINPGRYLPEDTNWYMNR